MLPVVAGARATKLQMVIYTLLLLPLSLVPWALGIAGPLYGVAAAGLSGLFVVAAIRVWFDDGERAARQMFAYSIIYLFLLFTLLIIDHTGGAA
jgi:protoheme IX farnesyltransferase